MKRIVCALILTIAVGIGSRHFRTGSYFWDKQLGDALYAVAVYLVVVLVQRRRAFPDAFAVALLICLGVELFKLTGIPLALRRYLVARWLLGTTFAFQNLALYLAGITAITALDRFYLRKNQSA